MKSCIYDGYIGHTRHHPRQHRFRFPFYFYGFALSELPALSNYLWWFGVNKARPVSLWEKDYLLPENGSLIENVASFTKVEDLDVFLVTVPRYWGYVFNPVNFYLLHQKGHIVSALAEVNNTFKDRHVYVLEELVKQEGVYEAFSDKVFHVSPFNDMLGNYRFKIDWQIDKIRIDVLLEKPGGWLFESYIEGNKRPLTHKQGILTMLRHPFCHWMTMPRILGHAALLYGRKKMNVFKRPAPVSPNTILERGKQRKENIVNHG